MFRLFFAQSATMNKYKDRLAEAMGDAGISPTKLAGLLGISYQAVKKVLDGKSGAFSAKNNDEAALILGVSSRWLSAGVGRKRVTETQEGVSLAHQVSHARQHTAAPITWEQMMSKYKKATLAESFIAIAPDDAMAPLARTGHEFLFNRAAEAKPGAGIIVVDKDGRMYLRQLRESDTPGNWIAHATNSAYRSFDHIKDGVEIVAVLKAPMRGWEDL